MTETIKKVTLASGQIITLVQLNRTSDVERLRAFFLGLPDEARHYLRYNVTKKEFVSARLAQLDDANHWRIVAELDGEIIGDATMDREPFAWTHHVAELRALVHPDHTNKGILAMMFEELVALGAKAKVERLFTEVIKVQTNLITDLEKEGFAYEATRKSYAKDSAGKLHDVIIMSNDLNLMWKRLKDHLEELDVPPSFYGGM
ncbi:MAG: GNAT family N-acetyltransferase [Myxococcota bacterium]|jgi:RimJ/RimL family protein N-acetyltransferase|nr:GNAT family N-acetyltransferase [Myxococcota bacterium]